MVKTNLATAGYNFNNVSIFIGNVNGIFSFATKCATCSNPISVTAADFNGYINLATADHMSKHHIWKLK